MPPTLRPLFADGEDIAAVGAMADGESDTCAQYIGRHSEVNACYSRMDITVAAARRGRKIFDGKRKLGEGVAEEGRPRRPPDRCGRNPGMPGRDLFQDIDFDALYREQRRRSSFGKKTRADWDRRAEHRSRREKGSDYAREFLARIDLSGVQTLLDIGCGTGNLALPLARRVRRVHALDFSAEMLRLLRANARAEGVRNLTVHRLAWTDDWARVPRADIAICSRALAVDDLRAALEKMNAQARLRCYATIHADATFLSADVYRVLRRPVVPRPGYIYAVNILYQMGIRARVDFLHTAGGLAYDSPEQFIEGIRWRLGSLSAAEEKRLLACYRALPRGADGKTCHRHDFTWALLSWETAR
jgi:SAM-dependent methyltransferase